jgi:predicted  nucleic acid-binding Zn-ribbon protein
MQLTTARLKQIIKEELEAITNEMTETETEVDPVDAEIASLEQQLAEAKKAKMQGAKGKATKKPLGAASHPDHKMSKMSGKTHDAKKGK